MTRWFSIAAALFLASAAWAADPGIRVEDPWVRVTFCQSTVAAGYMALIETAGKDNALVGLEMENGLRAELHETVVDGTVARMRLNTSLSIPANGRAELTPAGGHIMIMGLTAPLKVGDTLPIRLIFADGTDMMAYFAVRRN